jgi:hypothetical protein
MPHSCKSKKSILSQPCEYRIDVLGRLDEDWSDRLSGMRILPGSCGCDPQVTVLVGRLEDQAELIGVLNSLYELHLPLMQVKLLEKEGQKEKRGNR